MAVWAAGDDVTADKLNQAYPGDWVPVTSFTGSWANRGVGYLDLAVRTMPGDNIQIVGSLTNPTATERDNGDQVFQLPSSVFYPDVETIFGIRDAGGVARGLRITTSGSVHVYSSAQIASSISINAVVFIGTT